MISELTELGECNLVQWRNAGNQLNGCVPAGLVDVGDTDLYKDLPAKSSQFSLVRPTKNGRLFLT